MIFPKTVRGFYWVVVKKFPLFFATMFLSGLLLSIANIAVYPLANKLIFSIFDGNNLSNFQYIIYVILGLFCLYTAIVLVDVIESVTKGRYIEQVNAYKNMLLTQRIFQNDGQYFIDNPSGQLLTWAQEVSSYQQTMTYKFWSSFVGVTIGFITIVGIMLSINIWVLLITLANGIISVVWQYFKLKPVNKTRREHRLAMAKWAGVRSDGFENALNVKQNGNAEYEAKYLYDARKPLMYLFHKMEYQDRIRWVPYSIVANIAEVCVILLSITLIYKGQMSISDVAFVMSAFNAITSAFTRMNKLIQEYSEASAIASVAWEKINGPVTIADIPNAKSIHLNKAPAIDFDNVSFGYGDRSVLKQFNLDIKPGEKIGLVGLSGAGKTTLCNLMLRMYDVDSGAVLVNGIDIRAIKQDSLRQNISFVPQESVLFNRSILENIRYARPHASRSDVITAAKRAHIHEFVMTLPNGYDTLVGNRGIKLSGGQRQRIAIARALLKNAPILILDEATSALDSQNELFIQKSLKLVMHKKTTIAIAHRLSTLRNMDRIVVMNHGRIIESGSHAALLRRGGAYKKLWDMQTNGFIG